MKYRAAIATVVLAILLCAGCMPPTIVPVMQAGITHHSLASNQ